MLTDVLSSSQNNTSPLRLWIWHIEFLNLSATCLMHQWQWPVFLILWWPSFLLTVKNKMLFSAMWKRQHLVNKQGLWGNQLYCKPWVTKVSRTCPHCNGSVGKSKSKVGGLCVTRELVHVTTWASTKMLTNMEMAEKISKEQTGRRNKKKIIGWKKCMMHHWDEYQWHRVRLWKEKMNAHFTVHLHTASHVLGTAVPIQICRAKASVCSWEQNLVTASWKPGQPKQETCPMSPLQNAIIRCVFYISYSTKQNQ